MQDPSPFAPLGATRYETTDPATAAELQRNDEVRALHGALAQLARSQAEQGGTVVPLRAAQRR